MVGCPEQECGRREGRQRGGEVALRGYGVSIEGESVVREEREREGGEEGAVREGRLRRGSFFFLF